MLESTVQPLVLVLEDLNWVDEPTQAVLDMLVDSVRASCILLLLSYRPDYQHGWGGRSCISQIRLEPLAPTQVEQLLDSLIGYDPSLDRLKRDLAQQTDGNPLFLEESVRALVGSRVLEGEPGRTGWRCDHHWRAGAAVRASGPRCPH